MVPVHVTITNQSPLITIVPPSQTVQIGDNIAPLTTSATDFHLDKLDVLPSWRPGTDPFIPGLPDFLVLSDSGCTNNGDGSKTCTWQIAGAIDQPPGAYSVQMVVADGWSESPAMALITVRPEDAPDYFGFFPLVLVADK